MTSPALFCSFPAPPVNRKAILRFAGERGDGEAILPLLEECLREAEGSLRFGVSYRPLPLAVTGNTVSAGPLSFASRDLARFIGSKTEGVLFCASVGHGMDRLISRYGRLSPAKALLFQALGAERVEALCDAFCEKLGVEYDIPTPSRFSPGYGDLPLSLQREILPLAEAGKYLGVSLGEGFLMSPTKTVTAFVALR